MERELSRKELATFLPPPYNNVARLPVPQQGAFTQRTAPPTLSRHTSSVSKFEASSPKS